MILSVQLSSVKYIYIAVKHLQDIFILQNWNYVSVKQQLPIHLSCQLRKPPFYFLFLWVWLL